MLAAMLHDTGHVAFGHYLEEMEGLLRGRSHEDYALLVLDELRALQGLPGHPPVRFGPSVVEEASVDRKVLREVVSNSWSVPDDKVEGFLRDVARILKPPHEAGGIVLRYDSQLLREESEKLKVDILHSIMDSAIDADKLDYLLRDALHCGVQYAEGIDTDRFFQSLTALPFLPDESALAAREDTAMAPALRASIGVTDKGVLPVESILIARYQMFSCVYWHRTTRAATAMLQFLVLAYLEAGYTLGATEERLDELIREFRNRDDDDALVWIKGRLRADLVREAKKLKLLEAMADGLLGRDRDLLYWTVFELKYERERDSRALRLYNGLMHYSLKGAAAGTPAEYVAFSRRVRDRFAELLLKQLGKGTVLDDGEVLIDIPPAGKDQVENVFVSEGDSVSAIQYLSPIANAVRDAFRYWVRRPRVFIGRTGWRKCEAAGLGEDDIWRACWLALEEMVESQLQFFQEEDPKKKRPSGKQ